MERISRLEEWPRAVAKKTPSAGLTEHRPAGRKVGKKTDSAKGYFYTGRRKTAGSNFSGSRRAQVPRMH